MSKKFQDPLSPSPGLLPWQVLFLFFICGLLAFNLTVAAVSATLILMFILYRYYWLKIPLWQPMIIFLAGFGLAWFCFPGCDQFVPQWMQNREKVLCRARIEQVKSKPGQRIQMIVKDMHCRTKNNEQFSLPGKMAWTWEAPLIWPSPGQTIQGWIRIKPVHGFINPGTFNVRFYWSLQGVNYKTYTAKGKADIICRGDIGRLWRMRQKVRERIERLTPDSQGAAILLALLMGEKYKLEYSTLDLIRKGSLAHCLALSGLHLGFMLTLAWLFAWTAGLLLPGIYLKIPRTKLMLYLAVPLVLMYLWLGQAKPSLVRASLMFFFWGALLLRGKNKILLDGLFFALFVICLFRPLSVFDLGLQMSVLAVAGIILTLPLVHSGQSFMLPNIFGRKALKPLLTILFISLAANLALLPLMNWCFGELSPHLYLNLLWLPLLGLVVLPLGLLGLGVSYLPFMEQTARAMFALAAQILDGLLALLAFMQEQGLLQVMLGLRPNWPEFVSYWLLLLILLYSWSWRRAVPKGLICLALFMLILPSLGREWQMSRNKVKLQVLDVGQGQAVLIEAPGGKRVLIDGGGSWNREFDLGRYVTAPVLTWGRSPRLDKVILTHPDFDHMRGLYYVLDNFRVHEFLYNGLWPYGWDGETLSKVLSRNRIPVRALSCDSKRLELGRDLYLEILHPEKDWQAKKANDLSLTFRLMHKQHGLALLPGDLEMQGLEKLMSKNLCLQADVLVLPHHGSKNSYHPFFYQKVNPDLGLISCKYLNHFGFPGENIVQAFQEMHIPLRTTAKCGCLSVVWDLKDMRIRLQETWD